MDETLSLGWTQGQARARERTYRLALAVNLVLYALCAVTAIAAPRWLGQILLLPVPKPAAWVSAWGGLLLVLCALYLPGYLKPLRFRYPNIVGVPARAVLALLYFCLGGTFLWFALFEALFCLLLGFLYFGLARAELMSRP